MMSPLSFTLAYDLLDPDGSINIKWDITSWKPDGYLATVTISNLQMYRPIPSPGWTLGWTWAKKEVIWSMVGAQAIDQGDCSDFKTNIPHTCERSPAIIDLLPGRVPENQQFPGCCKGGVLGSRGLDETAAFQVNVGHSGTSRKTVRVPRRFYLLGPGASYTCGSAMVVPSSVFLSDDGRRRSRAMMTWTVTCTYSPMLVSKNPNCCVSLSSFYNPMITPCSTCACGCKHKHNCIERGSEIPTHLKPNLVNNGDAQPLQCTQHMCPIQVHWHFKVNYKKYWRVKITVTNLNYWMDYSHWNLVLQHPNLNNVVRVYNFTYKPLLYHSMNDTGVFYGVKDGNEVLMGARNGGNVHSEMILGKDEKEFTLDGGWVFPRKVYFNGDECLMPPPDSYPFLPESPSLIQPSLFAGALLLILLAFCSFWCGSKIKTHKTKRKTFLLSRTNL
ncbi:COBRA-LIKE4, IRREGULAR XYLEM 6 [Hibiscus trionum]|uniref:COBRA-like protein n=1 Tax=Hibiscus trionum TaxID=183268 RepID=A0A9W7IJB0_HIBTR|nr:COBRA-LIKE4, IRREGULAR XYLEM 6 [Hibiscus trionum]